MALSTELTSASEMRSIEAVEDTREKEQMYAQECARVRHNLEQTLRSALGSSSLLTERDVKDYMNMSSDEAFRKAGARTYKEQYTWLQDNPKYIEKMIQESREFSYRYKTAITKAKNEGALNDSNVRHLEEVVNRRSGNWQEVKAFFTQSDRKDSLTSWAKTWAKVAEQKKKVDALQKRLKLKNDALPELAALRGAEKTAKVVDRLKLLEDAFDALTRHEHKDSALYTKAQDAMLPALAAGAMSTTQVRKNLARIFRKYKGDALQTYVTSTLPSRVRDWIKDVAQFRDAAKVCAKAGMKTISEDAFFAQNYAQRRTTLVEMQTATRKAEHPDRHPLLQQAERLIQKDDWKGAGRLVAKAEDASLSREDQRFAFDLKQQIRMEQSTKTPAGGKGGAESPMQEVEKKREKLGKAMSGMPEDIRAYYNWAYREGGALKRDRIRRLRTWHYNVKWAHDHGFMNDEEQFMGLKDDADKDTEKINEDGHRERGVEKIKVDKAKEGVEGGNRKFEGGESRGATWYVYKKESMEEMRKHVDHELTEGKKNYWGLAASENVTLKKSIESFLILNPLIKDLDSAEVRAGGLVSQESVKLEHYGASETPKQTAA